MILKSSRCWNGETFAAAAIEIENGRVRRWLAYETPADIDYGALRVVPGFIDLHTHGGFGCDLMKTNEAGVRTWLRGVPKFGTTALLATTFTDSRQSQLKAIQNVVNVCKEGYAGAEVLGIYLEGPFIGTEYVGGMEARWIQAPSIEEYDLYHAAGQGMIRLCTVAPEREGAFELIDYLVSLGVIPAAGHTAADYETICRAAEHGLRDMTHTFNCMSPLHHRKPGCVGAAMLNDELFCECICDNAMVSIPAARILAKMKGREKLIFVTDALALQGMPPGVFFTSGFNTEVREDGSCVEVGTGMYMGSTLGMNHIVKIAAEECKIDFASVMDAASYNAATLLGLQERKGRILPDYDADIAVLADDYSVVQTYCRGVAQL